MVSLAVGIQEMAHDFSYATVQRSRGCKFHVRHLDISNIFPHSFLSRFWWSIYFGSFYCPVMSQMTDLPSSLLHFSLRTQSRSSSPLPLFPCLLLFSIQNILFHSLAFPNPYHAKPLRFGKNKKKIFLTKNNPCDN